jgi:hypothetical protein
MQHAAVHPGMGMGLLGTAERLHGSCRNEGVDVQKRPGPTIRQPSDSRFEGDLPQDSVFETKHILRLRFRLQLLAVDIQLL